MKSEKLDLNTLYFFKNDKFICIERALNDEGDNIIKFKFFLRKGDEINEDKQATYIDSDEVYDLFDNFLKENHDRNKY